MTYARCVIAMQEILLVNDREKGVNVCKVEMEEKTLHVWWRQLRVDILFLPHCIIRCLLRIPVSREAPERRPR